MSLFFKISIVFFVSMLIVSCGTMKRKLGSNQYLAWYNQPTNGTVFVQEQESVKTTLKYYPLECDAARCAIDNCLSKEEIKEQLKSPEQKLVFKLKFETPNLGLFEYKESALLPKNERLEYFSFHMKKDIQLITKLGDTIPCSNMLFEHTPPEIPMGLFEIVFSGVSLDQLHSITIHNKAISVDQVLFDFSKTKFNLPQIKI